MKLPAKPCVALPSGKPLTSSPLRVCFLRGYRVGHMASDEHRPHVTRHESEIDFGESGVTFQERKEAENNKDPGD